MCTRHCLNIVIALIKTESCLACAFETSTGNIFWLGDYPLIANEASLQVQVPKSPQRIKATLRNIWLWSLFHCTTWHSAFLWDQHEYEWCQSLPIAGAVTRPNGSSLSVLEKLTMVKWTGQTASCATVCEQHHGSVKGKFFKWYKIFVFFEPDDGYLIYPQASCL